MTYDKTQEKLCAILAGVMQDGMEAPGSGTSPRQVKATIHQALDAINALFEEVVGPMQPVNEELIRESASDDIPLSEWVAWGRNDLRTEIKDQWYGGKE